MPIIYILVRMRSTFIFFLLILLSGSADGQIRSSFDFLIGLDRSHRFNQELDQSNNGRAVAYYERSPYEHSIPGWRIGFNYSQLIFDDVKIKLGARVVRGGFTSGQINDFATQQQQDGTDGWIVEPPLTDRFKRTYNFYFLELPIGLRYEYDFTRNYQPYVEVGMGPAILIGSQVRDVTNIRIKRSKLDDLQVVQFVGYISPGFNRRMSEESMIFFQPIMRVHSTTLQKDSEQQDHLYSVGIEIGWRKILN